MTKPVVYNWVAASTAAIAPLQSLAAAGTLTLSGQYSVQNPLFANLYPMVRNISLTSANNLSAVNFTITSTTGQQEVIAGPNNNTVETVGTFGTIQSITTNGAVNAVSVGLGHIGSLVWHGNDYNRMVMNDGIQVVVTGTITYSFDVTLDDVNKVSVPTVFNPIVAMTGATTNQLANYTTPIAYSRIRITASTAGATLTETICQQGIT